MAMFTAVYNVYNITVMKRVRKTPKKWRLNYIITYLNGEKANAYRHFVHDVLITAATLRKIDYAIENESSLFDDIRDKLHTPFQDVVCGLVRFRSSSQSLSSVKEFRSIIDGLFQGYGLFLQGDPFDVHSQLQKYLKGDNFPEEFCRPLDYPFVEYHNGKKSVLSTTEASLQALQDEDENIAEHQS